MKTESTTPKEHVEMENRIHEAHVDKLLALYKTVVDENIYESMQQSVVDDRKDKCKESYIFTMLCYHMVNGLVYGNW